jgi:hypothetical protein
MRRTAEMRRRGTYPHRIDDPGMRDAPELELDALPLVQPTLDAGGVPYSGEWREEVMCKLPDVLNPGDRIRGVVSLRRAWPFAVGGFSSGQLAIGVGAVPPGTFHVILFVRTRGGRIALTVPPIANAGTAALGNELQALVSNVGGGVGAGGPAEIDVLYDGAAVGAIQDLSFVIMGFDGESNLRRYDRR